MKKILLLFLMMPFFSFAQNEETFDLRWKINDTITYTTIVEDKIIEKEQINEKADSILEASKTLLKGLPYKAPELNYETILYPDKNENIDIAMFLYEVKRDTNNNIIPRGISDRKTIALRGKVSQEGQLLSFYYRTTQSNLVRLLFELPDKRVKVGDTWSLATNLIQVDQSYHVDSSAQKNIVLLEKVIEKDGEKIAIIKYDIEQYTSGSFGDLGSRIENEKNEGIIMEVTHRAVGHFSITQGIWLSYDGVMEIDTNYSMRILGKKQTVFKLTPEIKSL